MHYIPQMACLSAQGCGVGFILNVGCKAQSLCYMKGPMLNRDGGGKGTTGGLGWCSLLSGEVGNVIL